MNRDLAFGILLEMVRGFKNSGMTDDEIRLSLWKAGRCPEYLSDELIKFVDDELE